MFELIAAVGLFLQQGQGTACVASPASGHSGARSLTWYINNESMTIDGSRYVKYGLPRVLGPGEVELVASAEGGYFYAEAGSDSREVLYLLTDLAGCEFQPYQIELPPPAPATRTRGPTRN
jgi:hypothetical protein